MFARYALVCHASTRFVMSKFERCENAVMFRYSTFFCACQALTYWPSGALAAPLIHQRQDDRTEGSRVPTQPNIIVGVLSAAAAFTLLAGVVLLIYFPSKRTWRKPAAAQAASQPEMTTAIPSTTVTRKQQTRSRSSLEIFNFGAPSRTVSTTIGGRGGSYRVSNSRYGGRRPPYRMSRIGLAISDTESDYDSDSDDGRSSFYSQSEADFDLEKYATNLVPRPPSSLIRLSPSSVSRYSSAASTESYSNRSSLRVEQQQQQQQQTFKPQPSTQQQEQYRPISWLRFSTTTSPRASSGPPRYIIPPAQLAAMHWLWSPNPAAMMPSDLASRRGQPTLQRIMVPN